MLSRVASAGSSCQVSSSTSPFLMIRCIDALLERVDSDTAEGIEEGFFFGALLDVDANQLFDHVSHLLLGKGGAKDLRQCRVTACTATDGHLVELLTFLVHAENADMANVMVAAGVHAAGNVQIQ